MSKSILPGIFVMPMLAHGMFGDIGSFVVGMAYCIGLLIPVGFIFFQIIEAIVQGIRSRY